MPKASVKHNVFVESKHFEPSIPEVKDDNDEVAQEGVERNWWDLSLQIAGPVINVRGPQRISGLGEDASDQDFVNAVKGLWGVDGEWIAVDSADKLGG